MLPPSLDLEAAAPKARTLAPPAQPIRVAWSSGSLLLQPLPQRLPASASHLNHNNLSREDPSITSNHRYLVNVPQEKI